MVQHLRDVVVASVRHLRLAHLDALVQFQPLHIEAVPDAKLYVVGAKDVNRSGVAIAYFGLRNLVLEGLRRCRVVVV